MRLANQILCGFIVILLILGTIGCQRQEKNTEFVPLMQTETEYILNTKSKKIHKTSCGTAGLMNPCNRQEYEGFS